MRLGDLVPHVEGARLVHGSGEVEVSGVAWDTRRLAAGQAWVAVPGFKMDALRFVPDAVARGAATIVVESLPAVMPEVPVVLVPNARAALADVAAAVCAHPSRSMPVVGVTGTDGKTSTTHLLSAVLEAAGRRTGWLTTVNTKIGDEVRPNAVDHTTPEAPVVQATLREMADSGVDVAVLETSSHALSLDRVRGVSYRAGVFTNLSEEHLNFHGTLEAYREAKGLLFQRLPAEGLAVLNADDPSSDYMELVTRARVLRYGLTSSPPLRATGVSLGPGGTTFRVVQDAVPELGLEAGDVRVQSRLVGRFNVANWLAAYGAATQFGARLEHLVAAAAKQEPVPGRMNLVRAGQPFAVVVDFAHTPQALAKALDTVRALVPGRLFLVFGMAGGRDASNRPVMGALAAERADYFLLSTDDPYDEDPAQIAAQIAAGAEAAGARRGERFDVELDRRVAIRSLLSGAQPGDAVLLAGKGHEQRMALKDGPVPWNDSQAAAEELAVLGYPG